MSYSFTILAATKDEAKVKIAEAFDAIVTTQPAHNHDRKAAADAASALLDLLAPPSDGRVFSVSVAGYLSWLVEGEFIAGSLSVNLSNIGTPVDPQAET